MAQAATTRTVKSAEDRIQEILDVAQTLFGTQGYDATSVQDIIDAVGIAKGTFYHHFRSKSDLLDAVVTQMVEQGQALTRAIVDDPQLDAISKLRQIFARSSTWKLERKEFLLELLRVMYRPENAILRDRLRSVSIAAGLPFLAGVIRQGVEEGVFDTEEPEELALIVLHMGQALGDAIALALLTAPRDEALARQAAGRARAYERSIERVLGAPAGSIELGLAEMYRRWLS